MEFRLPAGVRILNVFLTHREAEELCPSKSRWSQQPGADHQSLQAPVPQVPSHML